MTRRILALSWQGRSRGRVEPGFTRVEPQRGPPTRPTRSRLLAVRRRSTTPRDRRAPGDRRVTNLQSASVTSAAKSAQLAMVADGPGGRRDIRVASSSVDRHGKTVSRQAAGDSAAQAPRASGHERYPWVDRSHVDDGRTMKEHDERGPGASDSTVDLASRPTPPVVSMMAGESRPDELTRKSSALGPRVSYCPEMCRATGDGSRCSRSSTSHSRRYASRCSVSGSSLSRPGMPTGGGFPAYRRRAYGGAAFLVPGLMAFSRSSIRRARYCGGFRLRSRPPRGRCAGPRRSRRHRRYGELRRRRRLARIIAIIAVVPGVIADIGIPALPVRVEAVLLTVLVFLGVNVAWLLLFDETASSARPSGR